MLKKHLLLIITSVITSLLFVSTSVTSSAAPIKPRMVVLTDISTWETDDSESLVRLLVHADMFEIEGIVVTTGWSYDSTPEQFINLVHDRINAYEKDLPNLLKRSGQKKFLQDETRQDIGYWPSPRYLREHTVFGSKKRGYSFIGKGNNSLGSDLIIKLVDEKDKRPLWITIWGGGNTLAQAIWQVQQERSPEQLKVFLHKLRVYAITDQDRGYQHGTPFSISSHQWLRRKFEKDLLFLWDESAWKFQNGTGKNSWDEYAAHIQSHGNLGSIYPKYKFGVEGDTPSFLHLMPTGLNNPNVPTQVGWGGYFQWGKGPDNETFAYVNHQNPANSITTKYEQYFYPATFNNFAARMDWAQDGNGNRNPIVIINKDQSLDIKTFTPRQGTKFKLDASKSRDPEGDKLTFKWWVMSEVGSYAKPVQILNNDSHHAMLQVPEDSATKSFHIICEVTDNGTPPLTSYRRLIFEPTK